MSPEPTIEHFDTVADEVPLLRTLLGCEWGRTLWTDDDASPCPEQATRIVVLHNPSHVEGVPARPTEVKLCETHRERVLTETTPHVD